MSETAGRGVPAVLLFLLLTRALVTIPALIGARTYPGTHYWAPFAVISGQVCASLRRFPCVWARWDAEHYLMIAVNGYRSVLQGYSVRDNLAFFPAYPVLIRALSFGVPELFAWTGVLISNAAFVIASVLLWRQLKVEFSESVAWGTIVTLSVFPTSFFFSAIYTEGLFLLWSVLVYVLSAQRRYVLAGFFVALASLTRATGILQAVIPLVKLVGEEGWRSVRLVATALVAGAGLVGLGGAALAMHVPLSAPGSVLSASWHRTIDWPWNVLMDGLTQAMSGFGTFDFLSGVLFIGLAVLGLFRLPRPLALYLAASVLSLLLWHSLPTFGLMSMSRYVLVFFPGFILLAAWLNRHPRVKWIAWSVSGIGLLLLTASFASGSWVD